MKQVYIMSGLPGSGKSTYAKGLRHDVPEGIPFCIFGNDSWRYDAEGNYNFKPDGIDPFGSCLRSYLGFIQHLSAGCAVVDNTNTSDYEMAPYISVAEAYGWSVEVITILCDLEVSLRANKHEVPLNTLAAMDRNLRTRILPSRWKLRTVLRTASGFCEG